jgi:glycosyltransferase involved in cell wall biosynthesis
MDGGENHSGAFAAMIFSIATPSFNAMPHLRACVGSIRGQCRTDAEYGIQHLVQDAESADGTCAFMEQLDRKIGTAYRLEYAREPDSGMYDAINRAWAKADGAILSWLNADEQYLPGTLQRVQEYFRVHPHIDAVFGNAIITDGQGNPYAARREIPLREWYVKNGFLYAMSCTTFYRRSLLERGWLKLDTAYRYAADADLVLQLLQRGVRFGHIDQYLSLFGVEPGRNLSFHPAHKEEIESLFRKYKGYSRAWMRRAVMMCRYAERVVHGCYKPASLAYDYALDEVPAYKRVTASKVGFRFTYDRFTGGEDVH